MKFPAEIEKFGRKDVFFFFAALVFVYTQVFQLPFTPIYFDGDVMVPVSNAMRMLDGQVIYRDFFHMTTPGAELFYETLFTFFGIKVWVLNFTLVLLALAQVGLIWFFSRKILTGFSIYLPAAIYLVVGFRQFGQDGSYRLFSVVFALAAVAVLIESRSCRHLVWAGCLCGISSFFGQHRGIVAIAGIFAFVTWENYGSGFDFRQLVKTAFMLLASFIGTIIITQSYFLWQAGIDNYYFSIVGFLGNNYRHDPMNNLSVYFADLPNFGDYLRSLSPISAVSGYVRGALAPVFYYVLIPFVYLVFLLFRWRKKLGVVSTNVYSKLWLLWFVGVFLAIGVSAPSAARYYQVAIPGIIVFVWLLQQNRYLSRLIPVGLILLSLVGVSYIVQRQITPKYYLDMPAGYSAFLSERTYERYQWVGANTEPGETLYEPHHPDFYFPFHHKNPTPMNLMRGSGYTPEFQVDSVVKALEASRPRLIIWPNGWSKLAKDRAPDDHLEGLWRFVQKNYKIKKVFEEPHNPTRNIFGDFEVWELGN